MKRRVIDWIGICVCLAAAGVAFFYPDMVRGRTFIITAAGAMGSVFLILAVRDRARRKEGERAGLLPSESELMTEVVLLSEEDTELAVWDIYGKTAMVIGRDVKENKVDLDLGRSPYASMVDIEHAVLNYSSGNWYVEDLGSSNGISVKKAGHGRVYKLSADTPCRLDRGDCMYIGLNRLLFR